MSVQFRKRLAYICIVISLIAAGAALMLAFTWHDSTLSRVRSRGYLKCGVDGKLLGFSKQVQGSEQAGFLHEEDRKAGFYGDAKGFNADFCRVIAIAVFGQSENKVAFLNVSLENRFRDLSVGTVDVLNDNSTWTADRDTGLGIDFGPIIFHDGQKFMVRANSNIRKLEDLNHKTICVLEHTTTIDNLRHLQRQNKLSWTLQTNGYQNKPFQDDEDLFREYLAQGNCDAISDDASTLAGVHLEMDHPEDHVIIPDQAISYEPLAPVVKEGDSQWRDIVNYAVWTTIYAEQRGLTEQNIEAKLKNPDEPAQKFFLGIDDTQSNSIGANLALDPQFALKIIEQLGNYAEIYDRNLGKVLHTRGPNQVWELNHEGRLFTPPF